MKRCWRRRPFCMLSAVPVVISESVSSIRSMDSGEDGGDLPDDVIDMVAKANSVQVEPSSVLPHIRASPCQIHTKKVKGKGQDVLYSTNSHVREIHTSKKWNPHPIKKITIQHNTSQGGAEPSKPSHKFDIDVRIPNPVPYPAKQPLLPQKLSSKDYVMTWLIHGSAPTGNSHFPDILQANKKAKSKNTPRKWELSE